MREIEGILRKEHTDMGLYLEEDEHFACLKKRGELAPLAVFNATQVLVTEILKEADQHLNWNKSGITFGRVR